MIRFQHTALALALFGLALTGCKKDAETVDTTPPPADTGMPAPTAPVDQTPMPERPGMAQASINAVELGKEVGPDLKIATPTDTFAPNDTIHAVVATTTSDPAASVKTKLTANWMFDGDQPVSEDSRDVTLSGDGMTEFRISKPDGLPAGDYTVQISMDGKMVQSKSFKVK